MTKTWMLAAIVVVICALAAAAGERMTVAGGEVERRTCPSAECGVVGRFFPGESVFVHETVEGWSRVSNYYSAACHDGRSSFVETGPDECTEANGIVQGEFAEWVRSEALADEQPDQRS